MKAKIVSLLKGSVDYLSGEKIASLLGVSRASVWKSIKKLRINGFEIDAVTNKGYKLLSVPDIPSDAVLSSMLSTSLIGKKIKYYPEIKSTNKTAIILAQNGSSSGTIVTADRQTDGKARFGYTWFSPSGKNLYLSVILKPEIKLTEISKIQSIAFRSLKEATEFFVPELGLLVASEGLFSSSYKIGGVLCEFQGETDKLHFIVIGFGLNISHKSMETESILSLTGKQLLRSEVTCKVLELLEKHYLELEENE